MSPACHYSQALESGALLLVPTETVWGVAARASDSAAIDKLYAAKGRDFNKPLALCIDSLDQAQSYGEFSPQATTLAQRYWPGPLTIIVSATPKAINTFDPRAFGEMNGQKTIAFRCADTPWRESLCGSPLVLTSANKSGEPDALSETQARGALPSIEAYNCPQSLSGKPSTIISCIAGKISVLRQGELKLDMDTLND